MLNFTSRDGLSINRLGEVDDNHLSYDFEGNMSAEILKDINNEFRGHAHGIVFRGQTVEYECIDSLLQFLNGTIGLRVRLGFILDEEEEEEGETSLSNFESVYDDVEEALPSLSNFEGVYDDETSGDVLTPLSNFEDGYVGDDEASENEVETSSSNKKSPVCVSEALLLPKRNYHVCPKCDVKFTRIDNLRRHTRDLHSAS
jgi:hypothetical protein